MLDRLQRRFQSAVRRTNGSTTLDLLLAPQELRSADPSLAADIASGSLGLAGSLVPINDGSPFSLSPPNPAFFAALHGFAWLSDLRAANTFDAHAVATRLVLDWIERFDRAGDDPWRPDIVARRFISWLSNASFLMQRAQSETYERLITSLARHLHALLAHGQARSNHPASLQIKIAAVFGCLCLTEQEDTLKPALDRLHHELDRQILPDGSHVSRNPAEIVELLLDLLPLKTCFTARDHAVPPQLIDITRRMIQMVRHMRLGDGGLARFHGMGPAYPDRIAAVLSYDDWQAPALDTATNSRYLRLQRRQSTILLDGGPPPPPGFAAEAHAGCLSFEMSCDQQLIIVNCGAPGPADQDWRLPARSTSSHSTLVLNDQSSSRIVRHGSGGNKLPLPYLIGPFQVEAILRDGDDGAAELRTSHAGYVEKHGMVHQRSLRLTAHGDRLDGHDRIHRAGKSGRSKSTLPFSIHFHISPRAKVTLASDPQHAVIILPDGQCWRLAAQNVVLGLEESIFLARLAGPIRGVQVVLRGQTMDDTEVRWRLQRVRAE
mgnify:CR=1 FL=1